MNILLDADLLVALVKSDDKNHEKARLIANEIKDCPLFVSPLTIPEAATVLSHKVSHRAACYFLREVRKRRYLTLNLTQELERQADGIFLKENRKGASWPDCLNLACLEIHHLDGIASFDKIYKRHHIVYVEDLID